MMDAIREFWFPPQCAGARSSGPDSASDASRRRCAGEDRAADLRVRSLGAYDGALRRAVLALKNGRRDVAAALGERLAAQIPCDALVIPVPTTAVRRRMRGFDGGVLLARIAAHCAGATGATLEDCATALRSSGAIVPQAVTVAARTLPP